MAPLPQSSTARLFVDYVTGNLATSQEHTVMMRSSGAITDDVPMQNAILALLQAIGPTNFRPGWRVLRVRYAAAGQNFSQPRTRVAGLASFLGTSGNAAPPHTEALEYAFQGRSLTTPRRVDLSLYGIAQLIPDNFRFPVGGPSPAWVGAAVGVLNGNNAALYTAIDGTSALWYAYVNANYNSYWERRIRSV